MFYRQSHGRDGLSSARIASVIVMRRAHNPIDFSACMMSFRIFKKIGKQKKNPKHLCQFRLCGFS